MTVVLLAGGQGRRMGNADKGLELLQGRPLAGWVVQRIAPQAGELLINANRNLDAYAAFGHRVITDRVTGFAGPLAGMHAGLSQARHDPVVFVPCDTPALPADLVARLLAPLQDDRVDLSLARTGRQSHPVICALRKRLLPQLEAYLGRGGRKVDAWYATLNAVDVAFDDQPEAFRNINTPEELQATARDPR
ncbi:MAG TPA: molybdenum cofactor guanylyltransferase MobA [Burkholderiales bacterium]